MYLTDHEGKSAANDNRKFWERKLNKVLGGEEGCEREDIPSFLTPDADRGVVYSDEIIEMKGKLTLHLRLAPDRPWQPHTAFAHLCVSDYPIPGGSKGWATSQRLLQSGWTIVPTAQVRVSFRDNFGNDSVAA